MAYGAGLKKISESTGISYDVVEAMAKAEAENYPELEGFFTNELIPAVEASLIPAKQWIPHPDFPKLIINLGTGYFRTPDGKLYSFKQSPSPEYLVKKGVHSSFSPTEMKNYCVQGLGAEFAKAAIYLAVWLFWKYERQLAGRAVLINQVHDAAYADASPDVAVTAAAMLQASMLAANDLFEYLFKWEVPAPVPTETTYGSSMAEEKHIDDSAFSAKVLAFRNVIRDGLMPGFIPSFDMTVSIQ